MSMNKTCAISNWISFLISVDIKHGEKEVAQRENHRWTTERRAQPEFCIATGPWEERFSFFLRHCIGLKSSRLSVPILVLNRMNRWKQVPADLPANGSGRIATSSRRVRLVTQVKRA